MSDLTMDAFREASRPKKGPRCTVDLVRDELAPTDREALDAALADPAITGEAIAKVLRGALHDIRAGSVNRHRAGRCGCTERTT